ncbi:hypothetical protein OPT61_g9491 [Boeremia exigua]|uniref:Uncharacterized protein n=1 Tax=Boeremia exigua TaxID=749465 RepID=A0ACC2HTW2_9PLEO|nr:hypothetical protein OPT61_g9491 [Boeremia exigua]
MSRSCSAGLAALRRQASGLPRHHAAAGREPGGADAGHQLAEEVSRQTAALSWTLTPLQRPEPRQPVHRRPGPVHPGQHCLGRDGPRPVPRSRDHHRERKPLHPPESRPVRHADMQEGPGSAGALPGQGEAAAAGPQPRCLAVRHHPGHKSVRGRRSRGRRERHQGHLQAPGAGARQDPQGPLFVGICARARRDGHHRSIRAVQDPAAAASPCARRRPGQRADQRYSRADSSKNVGNSILYEAVLTILDIEADSGLRVLGVNILGKFLSNRDNNIRYVALNTLNKVVAVEPNAVQRHRNTILDCLRDPDISIRRRALDLSFTLINESNVRVLIRELLAFLEVADNEFKPVMTSQIGIAADRFAPNKRWHVDTMLRVLKLAGNYVKEQILSSFVRLIATTTDLQTYSVQKLYAALKEDITQEGLILAGSWVIGEYGDALLRGGQYEEEEQVQEVKESDIVDLLETILTSSYAGLIVQQYIITASIKLTTRLSDPAQIERLRRLLQRYGSNLDVESQQRAVEYSNLFGHDAVRRGVLEKMPAPEIREEQRVLGEATKKRQSKVLKKKPAQAATEDLLLDLMGDSGVPEANGTGSGSQQNQDLLADILGGSTSSPPPQTTSPTPQSNVANIMDLFNSGPSSSPAPAQSRPPPQAASTDLLGGLGSMSSPPQPSAPVASGPPAHPVYNKNDLVITFQLKRDANAVQLLARFRNTGGSGQLSAVNLQAAVPKSQKLQLQPISASELAAGQDATQQMRVTSVNGAPPARLRLRLKLSYAGSAGPAQEQVDWSEPT